VILGRKAVAFFDFAKSLRLIIYPKSKQGCLAAEVQLKEAPSISTLFTGFQS